MRSPHEIIEQVWAHKRGWVRDGRKGAPDPFEVTPEEFTRLRMSNRPEITLRAELGRNEITVFGVEIWTK